MVQMNWKSRTCESDLILDSNTLSILVHYDLMASAPYAYCCNCGSPPPIWDIEKKSLPYYILFLTRTAVEIHFLNKSCYFSYIFLVAV